MRYLIGGRVSNHHERLYSFEFPEQKGALLKFLEILGKRWNISLFHYRAHGADYGNILAAFQLGEKDNAEFEQALAELGYVYEDVSEVKRIDISYDRKTKRAVKITALFYIIILSF